MSFQCFQSTSYVIILCGESDMPFENSCMSIVFRSQMMSSYTVSHVEWKVQDGKYDNKDPLLKPCCILK